MMQKKKENEVKARKELEEAEVKDEDEKRTHRNRRKWRSSVVSNPVPWRRKVSHLSSAQQQQRRCRRPFSKAI